MARANLIHDVIVDFGPHLAALTLDGDFGSYYSAHDRLYQLARNKGDGKFAEVTPVADTPDQWHVKLAPGVVSSGPQSGVLRMRSVVSGVEGV